MRVLMTTDTIGGVWTFTKELSRELLESGCATAMVSLGRKPSTGHRAWVDQQTAAWGAEFRFEAADAPLEWMEDNGRAFTEPEKLLRRVAEEFGADLLLSSQFCFGALDCEMPRIVVAHSDVLSWADACRAEGLQDSAWLQTYSDLVQRGLRRADAVVAPTRWMLDAVAGHFQLPAEQRVIANGRTIASSGADSGRKLQAVTAGRLWDEAKNLRMLEHVRSPMPLLIAGEVEHESSRLRVQGSTTTFVGALNEEALLNLFCESSVYVCTSLYEPFGLAPLEAALCGCAVLAKDIAPLREVWGGAASYFSGAQSLSELLARLSTDSKLLQEAQSRSRRRAREFSSRKMTDKYIELFRSMRKEAAVGQYAE